MSGGVYDYAYMKVAQMAEELADSVNPKRREFAEHMRLVAEAMRAIEWVDSGDCSEPHDTDAIKRCLSKRVKAGVRK